MPNIPGCMMRAVRRNQAGRHPSSTTSCELFRRPPRAAPAQTRVNPTGDHAAKGGPQRQADERRLARLYATNPLQACK